MVRTSTAVVAAALSATLGGAAAEPRSWDKAMEMAKETLPKINYKERREFLHGIKIGEENHKFGTPLYVPSHKGYTRRSKDLHIPGLKFQDGASGYRTLDEAVGSATCFPSMLALASTWDTKLSQAYGTAIGGEFKGKGASVLMGPNLNVHRTQNDGRNVLSLSGEDPFLGASLAREYISGVQSQGVIAAPKNFAYSEGKTHGNANVLVTESAAWNYYYPPFQAAVDAGAAAMTCPSNSVNGIPACGNKKLLNEDLREKMGFKGFVVSDWGASSSGLLLGGVKMVESGMDLEMPNEALLSKAALMFADKKIDSSTQAVWDHGVLHLLGSIYRMGLESAEGCAGPHKCYEALLENVTSSSHTTLARTVATDAVTLLKNDGVLPLEKGRVKTIAVVGPAAAQVQDLSAGDAADYYSAGGSEHCRAAYVATPLQALSRQAARLGIQVVTTPSKELSDVLAAVKSADVAVVVAGATSTDGEPRQTLDLDDGMDKIIAEVAKVKKTVVLLQTPGAVLTPWRSDVSAIANLFLAGQETGSAWAAVVFGDADPAGRLPVAFPVAAENMAKVNFAEGEDRTVVHYNGLFTSYREGTQKAAFPFGHGLSYTTFGYGTPELKVKDCDARVCVSLSVTNTGSRKGREVAQAYLEFPTESEMPRKVLRGFRKTKMLAPGESEELTFAFSERDLSTYHTGVWALWRGVIARFGASSEDLRQELALLTPEAEKKAAEMLAALEAAEAEKKAAAEAERLAAKAAKAPKPQPAKKVVEAANKGAGAGKKSAEPVKKNGHVYKNLRQAPVSKHT